MLSSCSPVARSRLERLHRYRWLQNEIWGLLKWRHVLCHPVENVAETLSHKGIQEHKNNEDLQESNNLHSPSSRGRDGGQAHLRRALKRCPPLKASKASFAFGKTLDRRVKAFTAGSGGVTSSEILAASQGQQIHNNSCKYHTWLLGFFIIHFKWTY